MSLQSPFHIVLISITSWRQITIDFGTDSELSLRELIRNQEDMHIKILLYKKCTSFLTRQQYMLYTIDFIYSPVFVNHLTIFKKENTLLITIYIFFLLEGFHVEICYIIWQVPSRVENSKIKEGLYNAKLCCFWPWRGRKIFVTTIVINHMASTV